MDTKKNNNYSDLRKHFEAPSIPDSTKLKRPTEIEYTLVNTRAICNRILRKL